MTMKLTLATLALALLPSFAMAICSGHDTSASACADGQTWDTATRTCVDTTA